MTSSGLMGQPLELAGRTLRNRLVATAHGIAAVEDGIPTDADAAYWSRLSRGGPAMIITGGVQVSKETTLRTRYLGEAWHPWSGRGFRKRVDAIAAGGAVPIVQLGHLGRETLGAPTFFPFEAPSDVRGPREPVASRVLSTDEVGGVARAFGESARQMVDGGYEGIEIHAAHGYLIAQFMSRLVNTRTDRYGGDVVGRSALLVEIVEQIRARTPDAILGVRFSVENDAGGLTVEDFVEVADVLRERAPVDYINISFGNRGYYVRDMATTAPPVAHAVRDLALAIGVPLLISSAFRRRDQIEQALQDGAALVGMARPYIADPQVATKLLQGREAEIRPCVSCNEDCRAFEPTAMCTVNPDLAPPGETRKPAEPVVLRLSPTVRADRVAVVGAGPAGLECATSLARAGIPVTLFEAGEAIGGQLRVAAAAPTRTGWQSLIDYYARQLEQWGVDCRFGVEAGPDEVAQFDSVVWAVGAQESAGPADWTGPARLSTTEFLEAPVESREPVVIDDGFGWWPSVSAVETALARGAERVTLLSAGTAFAGTIPAESRLQLMERLRGRPVRLLLGASVVAADDQGLTVAVNGSSWTERIEADLCIGVGERRAREIPALDAGSHWTIGDGVMPRRVSHAIAEGRATALRVAAHVA